MNFLTEHGIDSYAQLTEKLSAITDNRNRVHTEIKAIEARQADLALVMKYASTYRKLKPIYEQYRHSGDKEKFMRGHESEIILFEAAARELKRLNAVLLPSTEKLNAELAALAAKKETLLTEHKSVRAEAQKYETVKQNVDALLSVPKEQEQEKRKQLE